MECRGISYETSTMHQLVGALREIKHQRVLEALTKQFASFVK